MQTETNVSEQLRSLEAEVEFWKNKSRKWSGKLDNIHLICHHWYDSGNYDGSELYDAIMGVLSS